jgi:hypothetical protein
MEITQNMQSGLARSVDGLEYLCGIRRIHGFWLLTKSQTIQPFGNHFQDPGSLEDSMTGIGTLESRRRPGSFRSVLIVKTFIGIDAD